MSNIKSTKDGLVEKSSGRKIVSPLDTLEAHTEQAKKLIRAGKLDANDPRAVIKSRPQSGWHYDTL